jgi:hypothetical protein
MEGTLYEWAAEAADALDLPEDARWVADKDTVQWVLDFARDVAHSVARPGAPVGAFIAGVAIGRAEQGPEALARIRAAVEPTLKNGGA